MPDMPIDIAGSLARGRSSVQNVKLRMQESIVQASEQQRQAWYNFEQCRVACGRNIDKHVEATRDYVAYHDRMMQHVEKAAGSECSRASSLGGWLDSAKKTAEREIGDW